MPGYRDDTPGCSAYRLKRYGFALYIILIDLLRIQIIYFYKAELIHKWFMKYRGHCGTGSSQQMVGSR